MAISSQPSAISKSGLSTELFPTQSSAHVTHCSLRVRPPAPETGRRRGGARRKAVGIEREASNIHWPIARGRRLAPRGELTSPGGSLRESRGASFDIAHHPEEDRGEGSPRSPNSHIKFSCLKC